MLVINGGRIFTSANGIIEKGNILIEDGKISAISNSETWDCKNTIDANDLIVMPGIVDAHSHIGGFGHEMNDQDLNEMTNNSTPQVEAHFSIDTDSDDFKLALKYGITTSAIAPGSGNVIGGLVCAVKSHGKNINDMCINKSIALKAALGGNPKGVYGKKNQLPMTRMGIAEVIRENLIRGKEYLDNKNNNDKNDFKYNYGLENIAKVLNKEIPMKVHCEQFDMLTIIRIAEEFDINFTIDHAWGASDYYDEIINSNCKGIVYGPIGILLLPGECGKIDIQSLIELDKRGMNCAIMTDGPITHPEMIITQAGEVYRFGGELERIINMLTINPAKIMGVDNRVGSIEVGKDADIVIFQGTPAVDTNARVVCTIINGEVVYSEFN